MKSLVQLRRTKGVEALGDSPPVLLMEVKLPWILNPLEVQLYSVFLSFTQLAANLQIQRLKSVIYEVCFILDTTKAGLEHAKLLLSM